MTRDGVDAWLNSLSIDESIDYCGKLCLINIYYCLKKRIVSRNALKRFLADCVNDALGTPAILQFTKVCNSEEAGRPVYFALKKVINHGSAPHENFVTAMEGGTFQQRLLSRSYKSTAGKTLPLRIRNSDDERDYVDVLKSLEGKDWSDPGAHLGKPFPRQINCWFTKHAMISTPGFSLLSRGERAEAVRDRLGLVHRKAGDCIVAITFPSTALRSTPGVEAAQPTFADGVNRRYAAFQSGAEYKRNRSDRWGTTVDLKKFAAGDPDMCGLPERVSSPVPISPRSFKVEYIGAINSDRGNSIVDNDNTFAERLSGPNAMKDMIAYIVAQVTA